jgi:VWFA-related protein
MRCTHAVVAAILPAVVGAATLLAQQPPTFRAEIASVQVDVRVVDEKGRFVRETASDLQILEDGQPQAISTFAMVDVPIGVPMRQTIAPPDIATNTAANQGRLFVLVLDDLSTHPLRAVTVRELAKYFVDHNLEDSDRLALITTSGSREVSHEFTVNRQRLHAVIDRFRGHSLAPAEKYEAKQRAAWLGDLAGRRKAIVLISEGIDFDIWNETLNPAGVTRNRCSWTRRRESPAPTATWRRSTCCQSPRDSTY